MAPSIEEVTIQNRREFQHYIYSREDTTFVDSWEWKVVLEKSYGLSNYWYLAREKGTIKGFLGLTLCNHPFFGRYLVTAPFGSEGGFYADSENVFSHLLEKAQKLQDQLRTRYSLIRHLKRGISSPHGWLQDQSYVTFHLSLDLDREHFLGKHIRSSLRNKIKNSLKSEFVAKFGGTELLDDFWIVINRSMRELGSPYHSRKYLETLLSEFNPKVQLVVIYDREQNPFGGALIAYHLAKACLIHSIFYKEYRTRNAGEFLYWSIISECYQRGIKSLDMGRSLAGSGNDVAKMKWRPRRSELAYWYRLSPGVKLPKVNQENPRLKLVIGLWQRLPLLITRKMGPKLITGIM